MAAANPIQGELPKDQSGFYLENTPVVVAFCEMEHDQMPAEPLTNRMRVSHRYERIQ